MQIAIRQTDGGLLAEKASELIHEAIADALDDVLEACLGQSRELCPIEEGTLADSGFTELDREELKGQVGYGTPYAVYQHQTVGLHHKDGKTDHWLEKTVYEHAEEYGESIAKAVRGRTGG